MANDPMVERLHKQREELMERFQYDFDAFVRDLKSREVSNPSPLLSHQHGPRKDRAHDT